MADDNTDDLYKDSGPTLTAFLEEMADHNKEQKEHMELNVKVTCPTCGKVHECTFPCSESIVPPNSAPLNERDFENKSPDRPSFYQ